ncbi:MAG: thioredoxin domain-containing protein [Planctomycetes bacterium]|nr:thioredoxin domain-containing protein [Planctomycetota bacterium]
METRARRNRLAGEKSPYLLQHASNPVDWFPWGPEAFDKARAEEKPVFLSIGYATCHWCHVMERESFESQEVADYLNAHYVSIKVDREERPDVDDIYMGAVQALSGQGGWPLTAFLTPDGQPFFGGTYFPYPSRYGRPSFLDLLQHIQALWADDRAKVVQSAGAIAAHLAGGASQFATGQALGLDTLKEAAGQLERRFDRAHGGWGEGTKFPTPHVLTFLLRHHDRTRAPGALDMVTRTLDAICQGGLRDHVGGGFHRYCVDRTWTIPHFEKMLYDQALLVRALVEAHLVTGDQAYAQVARETIDFVLRDMTTADGAFTSAWDADSEGVEGKFYVWTEAELKALLGDDFAAFARVHGVTAHGNHEEVPGGNHLLVVTPVPEAAKRLGTTPDALEATLARCRARLLAVRGERVPPLHDDKVLADWNGLMIGALAVAARGLGEPRFAEAAARAATFVLERMRGPDGALMHRWREGELAVPAMSDDLAFLAWGLIDLYAATRDPRWLAEARRLADDLVRGFRDEAHGGVFLVREGTALIHRPKPTYDGAVPAGNSVAALVLVTLGRLGQDEALAREGARCLDAAAELLAKAGGHGGTQALQALDLHLGPAREVVVAGDLAAADTQALLRELDRRFLPRTVVVHRPTDPGPIAALAPFAAAQGPIDGRATAYVCQDYACQRPVHGPDELAALLDAR